MTKNYIAEMIDLTGDSYLNPVPAVYDNGQHPRDIGTIRSISVHHDATQRDHDYDSVARYHAEAAEHYTRLGPGLQYHYKIDNVGQIFHVRPLTTWLYCVGSVENVSTIAICLDGNFETQQPTLEQCEAFFQLAKELSTNHPEFPATWPNVRPHADFSPTACCGANFRNYVYAIKDEATALQFPANAGYDWPTLQPNYTAPVVVPPAVPVTVTPPTPPASTIVTAPVAPATPPPVVKVADATPCAPLVAPTASPQVSWLAPAWVTGLIEWLKRIIKL